MVYWARIGAAIGLFFHTLFKMHRSQITTETIKFIDPKESPWEKWVYECVDCKKFRVVIERPAWEMKSEEKKETNPAPQEPESKKEPFDGHYKRRDETIH